MTGLPVRPWLMLVTDRTRLCAAAGRPLDDAPALLEAQARAAAAAGVTALQLREYDLEGADLLALAVRLAAVFPPDRLLVNERADVAAAAGTGVHLRAASMPAARLRPWLPGDAWLTRSVHGVAEARTAGPVTALVAGTVHPTPSKPAYHPTLGLTRLREVVAAAAAPVLAIGGLSARDWPAVRTAGAAGLAAIGWFLPRAGESVVDAVARAAGEWAAVADAAGGC